MCIYALCNTLLEDLPIPEDLKHQLHIPPGHLLEGVRLRHLLKVGQDVLERLGPQIIGGMQVGGQKYRRGTPNM